jgi:hypothetical protein
MRVSSTGALIRAYKTFKNAKPDELFYMGNKVWPTDHWNRDYFFNWFRECLNNKINAHDPRFVQPPENYERDLRHDVQCVRDYARGIRHSGCRNLLHLDEFKKRYPHINNQERE